MINFNTDFAVIAEIGCNHEGSFEKAVELTQLAAQSGANIIKFQSYTPERFIAANDSIRMERIKRFALTAEEHLQLYALTKSLGVIFMSTPVTEDWVNFLNPLCPAFKIASGDITFKPVIQKAAQTGKPLIVSTGAATIEEIDQAVEWIKTSVDTNDLKERLILMHCVSSYPTPIQEANILSIPYLRERYGLNVGYSNHVIGMSACLAAVALGANVIEIHFTDQKEGREFRDHALSFESNDLKNFIYLAKEIRKSLGKYDKHIQPCEGNNIPLIRKGIVAAKDIKAGEVLTEDNLMFSRPATEFRSGDLSQLVGKKINCDILRGSLIYKDAIICVE